MSLTDWAVLAVIVAAIWLFLGRAAHRVGGIGFKLLLLVALVGGVAVIVAPYATAAEKPWVTCGSTVTWGIQPSPGTPATAKAAIGAAFSEVAAVTGLTVMVQAEGAPGTATTVFAWDDPGTGVTFADGSVAADTNGMTGVHSRVHYFSRTGPNAGKPLSALLLKAITQDENVTVQATAGHLTPADRAALAAACKAQASAAPSASSTPAPGVAAVTPAPNGTAVVDAPATATPPERVAVTAREKLLGYGGAGAAAIVLTLTLLSSRIRTLATKRGHTIPSWTSIRDRISGLLRRPSKA